MRRLWFVWVGTFLCFVCAPGMWVCGVLQGLDLVALRCRNLPGSFLSKAGARSLDFFFAAAFLFWPLCCVFFAFCVLCFAFSWIFCLYFFIFILVAARGSRFVLVPVGCHGLLLIEYLLYRGNWHVQYWWRCFRFWVWKAPACSIGAQKNVLTPFVWLVQACLSAGQLLLEKRSRNTRRGRGATLANLKPPKSSGLGSWLGSGFVWTDVHGRNWLKGCAVTFFHTDNASRGVALSLGCSSRHLVLGNKITASISAPALF